MKSVSCLAFHYWVKIKLMQRYPSYTLLLILFLALGTLGQGGVSQVVVPPERRAQVIAQGDLYTQLGNKSLQARIAAIPTPFVFPEDLLGAGSVASTHKPVYSDAEVVKAVARSLKLQGLLVKHDQQCLYLEQGKVTVGDTFQALVQGVLYTLTLAYVNSNTFTLKLNEALWTQPFDTINSASIHFDKK